MHDDCEEYIIQIPPVLCRQPLYSTFPSKRAKPVRLVRLTEGALNLESIRTRNLELFEAYWKVLLTHVFRRVGNLPRFSSLSNRPNSLTHSPARRTAE